MGTIQSRRRSDGTTGYTAMIRLKRKGEIIHSETETFDRRQLAQEWIRRREAELDKLRAAGRLGGARLTLGQCIQWYIDNVKETADWGRTKDADLKKLLKAPIASIPANNLLASDYIEHVLARRDAGAGPATVGNDLVWIGEVLRSARPTLGINASLDELMTARDELRRRKVIAKSKFRDRRPTEKEKEKLREHFRNRDARAKIPMLDIMEYAMLSARRESEITRLKRVDLDRDKRIVWLDDVKHPRMKKGNRRAFRMLDAAWEIVDRQPVGDLIFPYKPESISSAFTRACGVLGIENLRFHDLRHEATSMLFERGYEIHEVAQFTLHDSWQTLKRYTHLRPEHVPEK